MRLPASARAFGWRTGKRAVDWSASKLKLASHVPWSTTASSSIAKTTLTRDARRSGTSASTVSAEDVDLTLTLDGLEDVAAGRDWAGRRMLEVGPKYGIHTRWIDERLAPSFVAFSDFEEDRHLHEPWEAGAGAPRVGVRRPAPRRGSARARPVRPRVLPRRPLPQRVPPGAARDAQPRHAPRRRDAARDDDRPAARLGPPRPLAARDGQGQDGADLRRAPDRARMDGLARRDRVHGLPAGVRRGAPPLPEDRRARGR